MKPFKQSVVAFVFLLVFVLLGLMPAGSSFCSSVGRHPVFENRGLASCCTFALGYENRKETRLFVSVGVVVEVGVGFGFGDAELEPPIIALCWIVYIVTSESIASFASSGYTFFA